MSMTWLPYPLLRVYAWIMAYFVWAWQGAKRDPRLTALLLLALAAIIVGGILAPTMPAQGMDTYPPASPITQYHTQLAAHDAAVRHNVPNAYMQCITEAESTRNPRAVGQAGELGADQIAPGTWLIWAGRANPINLWKGPFNAWANTDTAAYMIAHGQSHQWGPRTIRLCGYYWTRFGY